MGTNLCIIPWCLKKPEVHSLAIILPRDPQLLPRSRRGGMQNFVRVCAWRDSACLDLDTGCGVHDEELCTKAKTVWSSCVVIGALTADLLIKYEYARWTLVQ